MFFIPKKIIIVVFFVQKKSFFCRIFHTEKHLLLLYFSYKKILIIVVFSCRKTLIVVFFIKKNTYYCCIFHTEKRLLLLYFSYRKRLITVVFFIQKNLDELKHELKMWASEDREHAGYVRHSNKGEFVLYMLRQCMRQHTSPGYINAIKVRVNVSLNCVQLWSRSHPPFPVWDYLSTDEVIPTWIHSVVYQFSSDCLQPLINPRSPL